MRIFYAVGLLLLINVQVNSSNENDKNFDKWFDKLTGEIGQGIAELKTDELPKKLSAEHPVQQLTLKEVTVTEFLQCDRFNEGLKDIGQFFYETFKLGGVLMKKLLSNLLACGNPLNEKICITKVIWDFSSDIIQYVPEIEAYKKEVQKLAKEVLEIFQYCAYRKNQ
uniref:Uncharacterized protein n=1 Tax=Rhodnius prolixus TaxID=13249 RepID=T1HIJ9_RHOPR